VALLENPVTTDASRHGFCIRDTSGVIRGLSLNFPGAFLVGDQRLLGLGSGSFLVERQARTGGLYLFKSYLNSPGYSFFFATTCNAKSAVLWEKLGGSAVPDSETEYILPIKLDVLLPAFLTGRTSSRVAVGIARTFGRCAIQSCSFSRADRGNSPPNLVGTGINSRSFFAVTGLQT